jgi:hypothetical protein
MLPDILRIILQSISIYWILIIIPLIVLFKIFFQKSFDRNTIITVKKNIKYSIICNKQNQVSCLFIGKYYIGYISSSNNNLNLYCLCTGNQFKKIIKKKSQVLIDTD